MRAQKVVMVVPSGVLPAGLDCYIGDEGGRYLSQRGILNGIRPAKSSGKSTGAEGSNFRRLLARLPNASDDLTRGAEVKLRIPIEGGGYRAGSRPRRPSPDMSEAKAPKRT
jgi:hypothetical protein